MTGFVRYESPMCKGQTKGQTMRLNLELITDNKIIKRTTLKLPDRSSRMSMVILAKKWASLSGVPSTTTTQGINNYTVHIPSADRKIIISKDSLDEVYTDKMVMYENKHYVWYKPEFSYGTKGVRA